MIRTTDPDYIKSIFAHPDIYGHVSDDYSPKRENWKPPSHPDLIYLRPEDGGACFMFVPHNGVMYEVHSAVLPECRENSLMFTSSCIAWMKLHTKIKCLFTWIPRGNFAARRLAEATGMKPVATIENSYQKGGKLISQTMMVMEV